MKFILYTLIIALSLFAPVTRLDIAKLSPVEAVAVYKEYGQVVLKTDEENEGRGENVHLALADLKKKAAVIIYLDTARYLLVGEGAETEAAALQAYLKEAVLVGNYAGGDVKEEAKYLDVHTDSAKPE